MVPVTGSQWNCPNCGAAVKSAYCGDCGERRLEPTTEGLGQRLRQLFRTVLDPKGRFWGSYRTLIFSPGELTTAYVAGRRKSYLSALQLFLATNFVFFIVQWVTGLNVFSIVLENNLEGQLYGDLATRLLTPHLAAIHLTLAEYAPFYDNMEKLLAKSLVIIMVPLFAVPVWLLSAPRRSPLVHITFATHFYAFLMVFLCTFFPVLSLALGLLGAAGVHLTVGQLDLVATGIEFAVCCSYLFLALGRVYRLHWLHQMISAVLLCYAVLYLLYIYRFILFLATLHAT